MSRILKAFINTAIIITFFIGCKKEEEINKLPSKPILFQPLNGAITGSDTVTFKWESTDREGDWIKYTFYISEDSVNWEPITLGGTGLFLSGLTWATISSLVDASDQENYFPYKVSQKYYWKVKAENYFSENIPAQASGESVSAVSYFFTAPPGISTLRDSSGHQYINLYWTEPENIDHVEITFEPQVSSITQPIKVNSGIEKVEMSGFENGTIYNFFVKTCDKLNHASDFDSIKALPLLPGLVHDADFNIYGVVKIGTQTWMMENLKTTSWQDGTQMKNEYGNLYTIGDNSNLYGLYYSSIAAKGEGSKNACPCGYHVPTDEDFKTFERYLGVPEGDINNNTYDFIRGEDEGVGNLLKSTTGWDDYNGVSGNGVDLYGFNLKPAGSIWFNWNNKIEEGMGSVTYLFTSTGGDFLMDRYFSSTFKGLGRGNMGYQVSIRCLKD